MAGIQALLTDPDFRAASPDAKRQALADTDEDFAASSRETQDSILRGMSAEIKRPPTVGDYVMGSLKTVAREALPMTGMAVGGILGAAAGAATTGPLAGMGAPTGAAIGGSLGYATGQAGNRLAASLMPSQPGQYVAQPPIGLETPPSGFLDNILTVGRDLATGLVMEAIPAALGGVGRGMRSITGLSEARPIDLATREAASRQGITLPAGAASGSGAISALESFPSKFPVGRQTSDVVAERLRLQAQRAAERLSTVTDISGREVRATMEQAGGTIRREVRAIATAQEQAPTQLVEDTLRTIGGQAKTRSQLGREVIGTGGAVEKARRARASVSYDDALMGHEALEVPLTKTQEITGKIVAFEARLRGFGTPATKRTESLGEIAGAGGEVEASALAPEARMELLQQKHPATEAIMGGGGIPTSSLSADFIERYGLQTTGTRTVEEAVALQQRLRGLARNATDDVTKRQLRNLVDAISDDIGVAMPGTALADAARQYKQEVALYFAKQAPLRKLLGKEPTKVADQILETPSTERLMEMVHIFPKETVTDLRRAVLDRLRQKSTSLSTGEVNPSLFEANLTKFGDENLRVLFGPQMAAVTALRQTLKTNFGRESGSSHLASLLEAEPERIVNILTRGKIKSIEDFDATWSLLSPRGKQETRFAMYQDVLESAINPSTREFEVKQFVAAKEKIPQDIWDRVMSSNDVAALRDLELVFKRIQTHVHLGESSGWSTVLGPSQILAVTAGSTGLALNAAMGGEDAASASKKAVLILGALLTPTILGKALFSKTGQRLMTSPGQPPQPNPAGPAGTLYRLGAGAVGGAMTP